MDDRYLTTQPAGNPNVTVAMDESWSLNQELAQNERMGRISHRLTSNRAFLNQLTTGAMPTSRTSGPNAGRFFQVPGGTYHIYRVSPPAAGGEADQAY
jgi:hypothetical protein